jgi:hypothetical protein
VIIIFVIREQKKRHAKIMEKVFSRVTNRNTEKVPAKIKQKHYESGLNVLQGGVEKNNRNEENRDGFLSHE